MYTAIQSTRYEKSRTKMPKRNVLRNNMSHCKMIAMRKNIEFHKIFFVHDSFSKMPFLLGISESSNRYGSHRRETNAVIQYRTNKKEQSHSCKIASDGISLNTYLQFPISLFLLHGLAETRLHCNGRFRNYIRKKEQRNLCPMNFFNGWFLVHVWHKLQLIRLTFDEFKRRQNDFDDGVIKANEFAPIAANKIETVTQPNGHEIANVAEKLFAAACRSKRKMHRTEPIDGPLYIDPHLNEKIKNPRKCTVDGIFDFETFANFT